MDIINKDKKFNVTCIGLNDFGEGEFKVGKSIYSVNNLLPKEKAIVIENDYQGIKKFQLYKITSPSKLRCDVNCKVYNKCGGCQLLHMSYDNQIKFKVDYVNKCFKEKKINAKVMEIVKADFIDGYRNKMQVAYKLKDKDIIYGFYEDKTHRIINNNYCQVQSKEQNEIANNVAKIMKELSIPPYNEDKRTGLIRFLIVRFSVYSKEILVTIVTNGKEFKARSEFVKRLRARCPYISTIVQNINTRKTSIILGDEEIVLFGKGYITEEINGIKFNISSQTFFQVNPYQVSKLYSKVSEYLALTNKETVIDCYCGVGTIGMILAPSAKVVYGVESNKISVLNARNNSYNNKIKNIHFVIDDATDYLNKLAKENVKIDALVLDPPRSGSTELFLNSVNKLKPNKVCYVSCEASTLARDLQILLKEYVIKKVGIVDMFVGTYHVETVVLLTRKDLK